MPIGSSLISNPLTVEGISSSMLDRYHKRADQDKRRAQDAAARQGKDVSL